jgi:hypothetical protein
MLFSTNLSFEAESMEEAQQIMASWWVTAGTTIHSLMAADMGVLTPTTVTKSGPIGDALLISAQRASPPPQPPLQPPPQLQQAARR